VAQHVARTLQPAEVVLLTQRGMRCVRQVTTDEV